MVDGSTLKQNITESFDVVVVGSGAGGAVVAKELAEGGMRVALVEEGPAFSPSEHRDMAVDAIYRMYRDRGFTTTLGKPAIPIPMGRVLGGTTAINSGTCFRTPSKIFRHWNEDLGLDELNEQEFQPIFDRVEREINVEPSDFGVMSRANTIFHELLSKRGTPGRPLRRNIRKCDGCGFCCYGCSTGAKQSTDVSYVPKAIRAGAVVYTNCTVEKFLVKGRRVHGLRGRFTDLDYANTGYTLEIQAPVVVVAGGTIPTPQLLRDNGIAVENRNLGRHLTIHPTTKVYAEFDEEVNGWEGTPQAYYLDLFEKEGIMFEGIFVPPDVAAMMVPFVGRRLNEFMRNYKHMAAFGLLISDVSRGRVVKLPFLGTTVLYNLVPQDVEKIRKGIAFLARVFLEGGAKRVYTLVHGFNEIQTEKDLERLENARIRAEDIEGAAFHPLGTCRMAKNEKLGVVDQSHRVFGWEGIYICDGSVVPTSLGVNPQETIMAFATRFAGIVLGKRIT